MTVSLKIPGGRLAEVVSGKWVFLVAVLMNIVGAVLSPICAVNGSGYLIGMRVLQGLGGGVTFPAMNVLIARWAPTNERSAITAIIYGGNFSRDRDLNAICRSNSPLPRLGSHLLHPRWVELYLVHFMVHFHH